MATLYLTPNTLGLATPENVAAVLPASVQKVIARLPYFVVENAKTARAFLKALNTNVPLARPLQQIVMHELNVNTPPQALSTLLKPLEEGFDVGLLSEAGVPAVADPGANLVKLAHQRAIKVVPLVGPSAILLALMASGMNGQCFAFHGYLPQNPQSRATAIGQLEKQSRALQQTEILIETPYRNVATLQALLQCCHTDTWLCTATDLSLSTENIASRPVSAWRTRPLEELEALHKRPTIFLLLAQQTAAMQ